MGCQVNTPAVGLMTQISREIEGQIPIPFKNSRTAPDDNVERAIADRETQKGQAVESNIKAIQHIQSFKGENVDTIA